MKFIAAWHFIHFYIINKKRTLQARSFQIYELVVTPIGFKPITF